MKVSSSITGLFITLAMASQVSATTYVETGDAGQTLATAQAVTNGTTVITGSLGGLQADMFSFGWGGGAFYVNSVGTPFDSQLFLFESTGKGIQGNDDGIAIAGPAYLQLASLNAGTYYLGISGYDYDPRNVANGLMFQSYPWANLYGPLSSTATLDHWSGTANNAGGNYTITFSQTTSDGQIHDVNPIGDPNAAPVPEPGTIALLGLGMAGLAAYGKRRKSNKA